MYTPMTTMQGQANLRLVGIPTEESRARKGHTKYDKWFDGAIEKSEAIQMPEDEFDAVRKAAFRYIEFRGLRGKTTVRQKKLSRSKTYLLWFYEEPSNGV